MPTTDMFDVAAALAQAAPDDPRPQALYVRTTDGVGATRLVNQTRALLETVTVVGPELAAWAAEHPEPAVQAAYLRHPGTPAAEVLARVGVARHRQVRAALLARTDLLTESDIRIVADPLVTDIADVLVDRWRHYPVDLVVAAMLRLEPENCRVSRAARVDEFASIARNPRNSEAVVFADGLNRTVRLAGLEGLRGDTLARAVREVLPVLTASRPGQVAAPPVKLGEALKVLGKDTVLDHANHAAATEVRAFLASHAAHMGAAGRLISTWDGRYPVSGPTIAETAEGTGFADLSTAQLTALWSNTAEDERTPELACDILTHRACNTPLAAAVHAHGLRGIKPRLRMTQETPLWMLAHRRAFLRLILSKRDKLAFRSARQERLDDDRVSDGVTRAQRTLWVAHALAEEVRTDTALWVQLLRVPDAPAEVLELAPWPAVSSALAKQQLSVTLVGHLVTRFAAAYTAESSGALLARVLDSGVPTGTALDAVHAASA